MCKEDYAVELSNTNVIIASFTTAHARLKLLSYLEAMGESVLYFDTDSLIYKLADGEEDLPVGDFLGDLTDELDGGSITSFVSVGPKSYIPTMCSCLMVQQRTRP